MGLNRFERGTLNLKMKWAKVLLICLSINTTFIAPISDNLLMLDIRRRIDVGGWLLKLVDFWS